MELSAYQPSLVLLDKYNESFLPFRQFQSMAKYLWKLFRIKKRASFEVKLKETQHC